MDKLNNLTPEKHIDDPEIHQKWCAPSQRDYNRTIRRIISLLNSDIPLQKALDAIVHHTARTMGAGVCILTLEPIGKILIPISSWKLPKTYLKKGLLDPEQSLSEVNKKEPVIIHDVNRDNRVQYPEEATKAGIISILGMPIIAEGKVEGSIRVYTSEYADFGTQDINFINTMANLAAIAMTKYILQRKKEMLEIDKIQSKTNPPYHSDKDTFGHPSEAEFAHILNFYDIEWLYEPRSFPLKWEGEQVIEMFTPDFYLPALNLYIELTTMKQKLVTEKNRKLKLLKKLYPDIKITLLYRKDYDRLLAKYGFGPLAEKRGQGVSHVLYSGDEIQKRVHEIAVRISGEYTNRKPIMIGVLRGVFCFMADLIRQITIPVEVEFMAISYYAGSNSATVRITKDIDLNIEGRHVILVEDIVDTGMTLNYVLSHLKSKNPASLAVCALLDKHVRRIVDVHLDYIGFEVPDEFVIGYGLDDREQYRNLPFIGILQTGENSKD
jgi:hypoxanthine phosphoribosyltransferase